MASGVFGFRYVAKVNRIMFFITRGVYRTFDGKSKTDTCPTWGGSDVLVVLAREFNNVPVMSLHGFQ